MPGHGTMPPDDALADALADAVCGAAVRAAESIVPDESLVWLLETAVAQLHQVVGELTEVGAGTRQMADSIRALQAIEWESPAGRAFADRGQRLQFRALELAGVAEEQAVLGRAAIEDLQHRIGRLRVQLAAARTALTTAATLGAC